MMELIGLSGCTNSLANNYDSSANVDDGSCEFWGCTNPNAANVRNPLD